MLEPLLSPAPAPFQQPLPELVRLSQLIRVTLTRSAAWLQWPQLGQAAQHAVLIPGRAGSGWDTKWRPENTSLGSLTWNAAEQPWHQTWPAQESQGCSHPAAHAGQWPGQLRREVESTPYKVFQKYFRIKIPFSVGSQQAEPFLFPVLCYTSQIHSEY